MSGIHPEQTFTTSAFRHDVQGLVSGAVLIFGPDPLRTLRRSSAVSSLRFTVAPESNAMKRPTWLRRLIGQLLSKYILLVLLVAAFLAIIMFNADALREVPIQATNEVYPVLTDTGIMYLGPWRALLSWLIVPLFAAMFLLTRNDRD